MSNDPFLDGLAVAKARARGPRRIPWGGILIASALVVGSIAFIIVGLVLTG